MADDRQDLPPADDTGSSGVPPDQRGATEPPQDQSQDQSQHQPQHQPPGEHAWDDTSRWATTGSQGEDHPRTTIAFVLSLVALVFVVLLFWLVIPPLLAIPMAIVGIVFGGQARRDMKAQPGRYRNQGLATAAVVLGWITLGLIVLGILLLLLVIAVFSGSFGEIVNDPQFQQEILDQLEQQQSLRLPM